MEIENSRIAPVVTHIGGQGAPVDNRGNGGSGASASAAEHGGSAADRLSLTGEARRLQELEQQVASAPAVDGKKVEAVRTAVENGTFAVNPDRIAEKMIRLEQALTDAR